MKCTQILILIFLSYIEIKAQSKNKLTAYITGQYSETIYDHTSILNPRAIGLGLQLIGNTKTKLKPIAELTADAFFSTYKIYIVDTFGRPVEDVPAAYTFFVWGIYPISKQLFVAASSGLSIINGKMYLSIKPSFGFYLSKQQKTLVKLSFTNTFNREPNTKEDFGFFTIGVGVKLF